MNRDVYATAEKITKRFIEDGWSANTSFSELTMDEAKKSGYLFAVDGIKKGRKYFKMRRSVNIYNDSGKIALLNLNTEH